MIYKYYSLAFVLLALGLQACGSGADAPQAVETVLPETSMVLDGTNIVDLADLDLVKSDMGDVSGHYNSEQGGAVVSLSVSPQQGETWTVKRVYTEPGRENFATQYSVRRTQFGLADAGNRLFLQKTSEGLVALEVNSGFDGIPSSYWIHYVRDATQQDATGGDR